MPKENTVLTMKDIARELGVSVATVSRALKGSTRISREKREAIVAYAKEHKFSPNPMAESLRNRRTMKIIGVIIPQFTHFYFSSILAGIEDEALKYGYRLLVAQSDEDYEREVETCRAFYENKVCGIIVSQSKNTYRYDHFQELMDKGVPLVFYDRICTGVNSSRVTVDDYMGAYAAVEYMINTGCRRIAFYGSSMKMEISKNRYNGWHDALRKHGLDPEGCVRMECDNREDAERVTPAVLESDNRPDAFFAINDDTAIGIMYGAAGARRHFRMRLHQRPARGGLRPDAHHRGAERIRGGTACGRHPYRQSRGADTRGQGGETRGEDTPDSKGNNENNVTPTPTLPKGGGWITISCHTLECISSSLPWGGLGWVLVDKLNYLKQ